MQNSVSSMSTDSSSVPSDDSFDMNRSPGDETLERMRNWRREPPVQRNPRLSEAHAHCLCHCQFQPSQFNADTSAFSLSSSSGLSDESSHFDINADFSSYESIQQAADNFLGLLQHPPVGVTAPRFLTATISISASPPLQLQLERQGQGTEVLEVEMSRGRVRDNDHDWASNDNSFDGAHSRLNPNMNQSQNREGIDRDEIEIGPITRKRSRLLASVSLTMPSDEASIGREQATPGTPDITGTKRRKTQADSNSVCDESTVEGENQNDSSSRPTPSSSSSSSSSSAPAAKTTEAVRRSGRIDRMKNVQLDEEGNEEYNPDPIIVGGVRDYHTLRRMDVNRRKKSTKFVRGG